MTGRVLCNADGAMLPVPQLARLHRVTELGAVEASPLEIAVLPRDLRGRVELPGTRARLNRDVGPYRFSVFSRMIRS